MEYAFDHVFRGPDGEWGVEQEGEQEEEEDHGVPEEAREGEETLE